LTETVRQTATPAPPRGANEVTPLTAVRGYLALWVVLYHFWNDAVRLIPGLDAVSPFVRMGNMAVPAFFILSGFVLAYNYADRFHQLRRREVARFLLLRLARIYPVHLFTLLAVLGMVAVSRRIGYQLTDAGYSPRDFVLNLFLEQTWVPDFRLNWNYPSWSISSEWFAYLVFPLAVAVALRHLTTRFRATTVCGLSLAGAVAMMLWWRPWPYFELVLVVPTFFSGAAAYWALRGRIDTGRSAALRWAPEGLAVAGVASAFAPSPEVVVASLLVCSFSLIVVLARLGAGCHAIWSAGLAVFLGEVSYSLYMTHTLAQKVLYRLLPTGQFESADLITRLGVVGAYAGLVIAACLATYFLVERPCRMFFKKLTRRPAPAAELKKAS
jgi:peptidoglycan/LPS O-acetylase OafA/YrhL